MNEIEIQKIERYLQKRFNISAIKLKPYPKSPDSAEVYIGSEFIGVIYKDEEDGELSYNFSMAILDVDLDTI